MQKVMKRDDIGLISNMYILYRPKPTITILRACSDAINRLNVRRSGISSRSADCLGTGGGCV
jgi:hypothetical protein